MRIWYDEDSKLLGLEPHEYLGYTVNAEKVGCRILGGIPQGMFEAKWDDKKKMIIIDLAKKIN